MNLSISFAKYTDMIFALVVSRNDEMRIMNLLIESRICHLLYWFCLAL